MAPESPIDELRASFRDGPIWPGVSQQPPNVGHYTWTLAFLDFIAS